MELIKHRKHPSATTGHEISEGVKHIAWARAARWMGWGFAEALIPILIVRNVGSFTEAGLVRSVLDLVLLFSVPFAGALVQRFSARYLIVMALALYPFVGASYLLAGLFGMTLFIVVARGLNGFIWSLENAGAAAYYRRLATSRSVSSSLGYIDTWAHLGWLGAAFAGMAMASFVPVHWLLFLIAPVSLIALSIVQGAPVDKVEDKAHKARPKLKEWLSGEWAQWTAWDRRMKMFGIVVAFVGVLEAFVWFFMPIDAYFRGADLPLVILLSAVGAIPAMVGYSLQKFADAKHEYALITGGLLGAAILVAAVAVFPAYIVKLVASFALGVIIEIFIVVQASLAPKVEPKGDDATNSLDTLATVGDVAAPIILGLLLDGFGFSKTAFIVALAAAGLCVWYASLLRKHHSA